jgi:hypothetical protein
MRIGCAVSVRGGWGDEAWGMQATFSGCLEDMYGWEAVFLFLLVASMVLMRKCS